MFPETFTLLQNEGYLMQGCFKSSLSGLLLAPNAQPGPFYSAFFNYAIGLERLLKIILLLDKWRRERQFPTDKELREKGHNVEKLYNESRPLFTQYVVPWKSTYEPDQINRELLHFLAHFANGSRYYNLNALVGSAPPQADNPIYLWQRLFYSTYAQDHPDAEPISSKPDVPEDSMSDSDLTCHHVVVAAARPHICWRLVQLLIPLQELLVAIRKQVHEQDLAIGGEHADTRPTSSISSSLTSATAAAPTTKATGALSWNTSPPPCSSASPPRPSAKTTWTAPHASAALG